MLPGFLFLTPRGSIAVALSFEGDLVRATCWAPIVGGAGCRLPDFPLKPFRCLGVGGFAHAAAVLAVPGPGSVVLAVPPHARPVYVAGIPSSHATRFHRRRPIVRRRPRACHLLGANRWRCRLSASRLSP